MTVCLTGCARYREGEPCCRWDGVPWPTPVDTEITDPEVLRKLAEVFDA